MIVDAMPAEWFMVQHMGTLESYCRHLVYARRIAKRIDTIALDEIDDIEALALAAKLHMMHVRETHAAAALAARMRLTQSSVVNEFTAGTRVLQHASKPQQPPWTAEAA
jgi:hypothetical protein